MSQKINTSIAFSIVWIMGIIVVIYVILEIQKTDFSYLYTTANNVSVFKELEY